MQTWIRRTGGVACCLSGKVSLFIEVRVLKEDEKLLVELCEGCPFPISCKVASVSRKEVGRGAPSHLRSNTVRPTTGQKNPEQLVESGDGDGELALEKYANLSGKCSIPRAVGGYCRDRSIIRMIIPNSFGGAAPLGRVIITLSRFSTKIPRTAVGTTSESTGGLLTRDCSFLYLQSSQHLLARTRS